MPDLDDEQEPAGDCPEPEPASGPEPEPDQASESEAEPAPPAEADELDAEERARLAPARKAGASNAWLVALAVTAIGAGAVFMAFQPARAGSRSILLIIGAPYLLLSAVTCLWLHLRGELRQRLGPAAGDVTKGFATALVLYGGAVLLNHLLTPKGSAREWWVIRAYLHVGDPTMATVWAVGFAVLIIAACEEVAWRGLVMGGLVSALGRNRGWLVTSVLYALTYAPTVTLLRDEFAGPNPLLVTAALGGGLVWGFIASRTGRLMPMVLAHALTTWAVVEYPIWRF